MNANCTSSPAKIERWCLNLIQAACLATLLLAPRFLLAQTNCTPRPPGLVAWWPGDGFALDVVGTNHGTLQNGATFGGGKAGQAFCFDGVDDSVAVSHAPALALTNSIGVSVWIKATNASECAGIVNKAGPSTSQSGFKIGMQGVQPVLRADFIKPTGGAGTWISANNSKPVLDGAWHHVAASYDGTNAVLYVDGIAGTAVSGMGYLGNNTAELLIGNDACCAARYFRGFIDELVIFNRALSASEVATLYVAGSAGMCFTNAPSPVFVQQPQSQAAIEARTASLFSAAMGSPRPACQWLFNGNLVGSATNATLVLTNLALSQAGNYSVVASNLFGSVTSAVAQLTIIEDFNLPGKSATNCTSKPAGLVAWWPGDGFAFDVAGTNDGTLQNGAGYAAGKVGRAFSFGGTNYVSVPNSATFNSLNGAMSFAAWFKVNAWDKTLQCIVAKGMAWGIQRNWDSRSLLFSSEGLSNKDLPGSIPVDDSQWHHVVCVYSGSMKYLYVDGSLDASTSATGVNLITTDPVLIGENPYYTGRRFNGLIDEVSIFTRALSSNEVATLYAVGSAGMCFTNAPAPVFVQQPQSQTGYLLSSVTINAAAMGTPRPSYQWQFNGNPIPNATNASLTLTNLALANGGYYAVLVSNQFGMALSSSALLTLKNIFGSYRYVMTTNAYAPFADWASGVRSEFGPAAEVVDWTTVKVRFGVSVPWLKAFFEAVGIMVPLQSWGNAVTWNGNQIWSGDRSYGIDRMEGTVPGWYLVHDQILNYWAVIGSWGSDRRIIARVPLPPGNTQFRSPETFELGWGDWDTDNPGVWEVGVPLSGPPLTNGSRAFSPTNVAATVLSGNYPANVNARLTSPDFVVPSVGGDALVVLRFQHWYSCGTGDAGQVQVSSWNGLSWGAWTTLAVVATNGTSARWQQQVVDLTAYQGQQLRLGFLHTANADGSVGAGWYLDQLELSSFIPTPVNLGAPVSGRFTANDQPQFFVVEVPPGGHLRLTLRDLDMLGVNELYLRRGALPSPGSYDYRFNINGAAGQTILAPDAGAGKWYILAYNASGPIPGDFTLQADFFTGIALESVSPSALGNSVPGTLDIRGAGFTPSAIVSLVKGGTSYLPTETSVVSGSQMLADFNFTAMPAGAYSLRVTSGTNSSELPFTVTSGGRPGLTTKLILPSQVGYHTPATIYVEYSNTGQVATLAPILEVSAQQLGLRGAILTLDESRLTQGFWTYSMPEGFASSVQFLASGKTPGILQPGELGRATVYYAGWRIDMADSNYSPLYWNLRVLASDSTNQIDWIGIKDSLRPSTLTTEQWDPVFGNLIGQLGATWGNYVQALDNNARYLAKLGVTVTDIRDLQSFELMRASGLSVTRTLASALDAQVQAPGLPITFTRSFSTDIPSHFRLSRFGRGWSDNWDYSLTNAPDGTVTILSPSGSRRVFQPDSRDASHYFAQPGDTATLTSLGGGAFALQEASGTRYAYSAGKLQSIQDTHTNRITCTYTGDQLTRLSHSAGPWLQIAYTGTRAAAMVDSVGRQTTFGYDGAAEHLASVTDYRGLATTYLYQSGLTSAATHALLDIGKPDGTHQLYTYDAQGRLASKSGCCGTGGTTTYAYDSAGNVIATDCLTNVSTYWLDHRGALVKSQDPLGNVTLRTFDANGQLVKVTDPAGRIRTYDYDAEGNLATETDALGYPTRYSYTGPFNRLSSVLDANGNPTRYNYEPDGDLASIVNAANLAEGWTYDAQGNRRSWQNRRGQTITYTNDSLGRVIARRYPDGTLHTFAYDPRGNLTNYTDATGSTAQQFDAQDRLTQITYPSGYWLRYTYDPAGRRASMTDHLGHRTDYHYGADARLQSLTDKTAREIVRYEYDLVGRMSRKTLGNGVYTTYAYDAAGQLLDLFNQQTNSAVLSRFQYTYDSRGRRVTMTTTYGTGDPRTSLAGLWRYDYDDTGQLIGWTAPWGRRVDYRYDGLGNRLLVRDNGTNIAYTINNLNQYTQVGSTTYQYDGDGNLTNKVAPEGSTSFSWWTDNKFLRVSGPEGVWENYYDAVGRRVRASEKGLLKEFTHDALSFGLVAGEYAQGSQIAQYNRGVGLVSKTDAASAQFYYTFDLTGSASEIVNNSLAVLNSYLGAPFGSPIVLNETIPNPYTFGGQFGTIVQQGPTMLAGVAPYAPALGRFTTPTFGMGNQYGFVPGVPGGPIILPPVGGPITLPPVGGGGGGGGGGGPGGGGGGGGRPEFCQPDEIQCYDPIKAKWGCCPRPGDPAGDICSKDEESYYDPLENKFKCRKKWPGPTPPTPPQPPQPPPPPFPPDWYCIKYPDQCMCHLEGDNMCVPTPSPRPLDPNELLGPGGYGPQNFVAAGSLLPYRINFENATNATAPAQFVTVQNVLATNLDLAAFELSSLGFGDRFFAIPSGSQHYERTETLTMNGFKFQVQIEAGLNLATRTVYATFRSLNPTNGLPPTVDIGFLPPENGTGRGMGHVSYVIRPRASLATGTEIRNVATIVFDQQPAIATDWKDPHNAALGIDTNKQALVTIDGSLPSSSVLPLSATATNGTFWVCWSGSDTGSGIAGYDIYVSSNGGPWTLWLANTPSNCLAFTGSSGASYGFYSVARDGAGNTELAPTSPDTTTVVVSETVSLPLSPGYNLVSVPFVGTGITNAESLARAIPYCRGVWRWDAGLQGWSGHLLGGPNNFSVSGGDALLASVTNSGTFTVTGTWVATPQTLRRGYNLLVLGKTHQTLTTAEALATSILNCTGVWKWDAAAQGWSGHRTGGPNNFSVSLGRAYLVFVTSDGQW